MAHATLRRREMMHGRRRHRVQVLPMYGVYMRCGFNNMVSAADPTIHSILACDIRTKGLTFVRMKEFLF